MAPQRAAFLPKRIHAPAIPRDLVSRNACAVVAKLHEAGFQAYLVGGCVRDLLLGRQPKDFDVATDAHPDAICALLPRSRPIGRRFRIVHVRMKGEVIEVSTFRSGGDDTASVQTAATTARDANAHVSANGVILRDNAYGTVDDDAFRRDFTVNALYYDPQDDMLLDYCDGMADIANKTLRLIGDPATRLREDPVRILRAARFVAKLDLQMHPHTQAAIAPARAMLAEVPPARLLDEFGKMFLNGHGARTFEVLERHRLDDMLFPLPVPAGALFRQALVNSDKRVWEGKPVTAGFLLAALLWPSYVERIRLAASAPRGERQGAFELAASDCFSALRKTIATPRRHGYFARDVWELQPPLERRTAAEVAAVLAHRRFRAAYDFLLLRAEIGEVPSALADWWTEAQLLTPEQLEEHQRGVTVPAERNECPSAVDATPSEAPPKRRRRRRRRRLGGRARVRPTQRSESDRTDSASPVKQQDGRRVTA